MRPVLRHLVRALAREPCGLLTDHQLLERYRDSRDERAFAVLLARHGPLVLGVCRRALGHEQDAEDVFQATFLILAKKAGTIRQGTSLGSWLHGVTTRLAWRARRSSGRRRRHEQQGAARPTPSRESDRGEALQALDEELRRLPEHLREPLLLCYLAGRTQQQAACQLGWSFGTLRRRLEQGRECLRRRLLHRGLAPAALLAATPDATSSAVAAVLAGATVRAALGGAVSSHVMTLTEKGLRTMFLTKTKLGIALALALTLGGGFVAHQTLTAQQPPQPEGQPFLNGFQMRAGQEYGIEGKPDSGTTSDLDRHLADVEKRLEAALKEVRAARQALKAAKGNAQVFSLKHARAAQVAEVLRAALPGSQARISTDEQANAVIVQVGEAEAPTVRRLIEALDAKQDRSGATGNAARPTPAR